MDDLISILIPVYNIKKYIEKCLESVITQTYENIEIIVIDDGSTDGSEKICDDYKKIDNRIHVIHKQNEGLVAARKTGVQIAKGQYCFCLDGDDWIESDAIEKLLFYIKKYDCDIVQGLAYFEYEDGSYVKRTEPVKAGKYNIFEKSNDLLSNLFIDCNTYGKRGISSNLCGCLVKKDVYLIHQMKVPNTLTRGEDDACYFPMVLTSDSMYLCNDYIYHYRQRKDGVGGSNSDYSKYSESVPLYKLILPIIEKHPARKELEKAFKIYLIIRLNWHTSLSLGVGFTNKYAFPFLKECMGKRIVIYGIGNVGKDYVDCIINLDDYCTLAGLVDEKAGRKYGEFAIYGIDEMERIQFDIVIIAMKNEDKADCARKTLEKNGVDSKRILWKDPQFLEGNYYKIPV